MESYLVRVNVMIADKDGNRKHQDWEYKFDDSSKGIYDLRSEAIEKGRSLIDFFENGLPSDSQFSSQKEAEFKKYKGFQAYSMEIVFMNEDGDEDILVGEECLDYLEVEAQYYRRNSINVAFTNIENDGRTSEVLEKDLGFLMSFLNN